MSSNAQRHEWFLFSSLRGNGNIGFTCDSTFRQILLDSTNDRHIVARCERCRQSIEFYSGLLGWRRWFLPRLPFAAAPRDKALFLTDGWDGITRE